MRVRLVAAVLAASAVLTINAAPVEAPQAARSAQSGDCVTIGTPKPGVTYHYTHAQSNGVTTQTSHQWETVTPTGSRVKNVGPAGTQIQVNEHHIVDDAAVLDRTSKESATGVVLEATSFKPGLVSDPAFRACAGQTWAIPSVTAAFQSQQQKASAQTPAGNLRIVAIRERITVPAGTFDTVRYIRTSQSVDEYWKSIEHGVVVKHIATVSGVTITETLTAIK
jgi:hypothetical protein